MVVQDLVDEGIEKKGIVAVEGKQAYSCGCY